MRDIHSAGPAAPSSRENTAVVGLRRPHTGFLAATMPGFNTQNVADAIVSATPPPGVCFRTTTSSVKKHATATMRLGSLIGQPTAAKTDGRTAIQQVTRQCGPSQHASPEHHHEGAQAIPPLLPAHGSPPPNEGQASSCDRPPAAQQAHTRRTGHYGVERAKRARKSKASQHLLAAAGAGSGRYHRPSEL